MAIDPAIRGMRSVLRDTQAAMNRLRDEIAAASRALDAERQQQADAERRGRMARDIGDAETAAVAQRFRERHGEWARLLERKLNVLRDELILTERDLAEMTQQLAQAEGGAQRGGEAPPEGDRSGRGKTPADDEELLRARMDRAARETAAAEQLAALKRKMGR